MKRWLFFKMLAQCGAALPGALLFFAGACVVPAQSLPRQEESKGQSAGTVSLPLKPLPPPRDGLFFSDVILRSGRSFPWMIFFDAEPPVFAVMNNEDTPAESRMEGKDYNDLPASMHLATGLFFRNPRAMEQLVIANSPAILRDWPAAKIKWVDGFRSLALRTNPGSAFGIAPEGFVAFNIQKTMAPGAFTGVELPNRIAGFDYVTIRTKAFTSPLRSDSWNKKNSLSLDKFASLREPFEFQSMETVPGALLTSLFAPGRPLLLNSKGSMRGIYVDTNPESGNFALVDTGEFWLAGRIELAPPIQEEPGNWLQVESETMKKFRIFKSKTRTPSPGTALFSLLERRDREFSPIPSTISPAQLRITRPLLAAAQESGIESVFRRMTAPESATIDTDKDRMAEALTYWRDVDSVDVFGEADKETPGAFKLRMVFKGKFQPVEETKSNNTTGVVFTSKPLAIEIERSFPADEDGKMRITDGHRLFVLSIDQRRLVVDEFAFEPTEKQSGSGGGVRSR